MDKCPECKKVVCDKYPGSRLANPDICYGTNEKGCLESQLAAERLRRDALVDAGCRYIEASDALADLHNKEHTVQDVVKLAGKSADAFDAFKGTLAALQNED